MQSHNENGQSISKECISQILLNLQASSSGWGSEHEFCRASHTAGVSEARPQEGSEGVTMHSHPSRR